MPRGIELTEREGCAEIFTHRYGLNVDTRNASAEVRLSGIAMAKLDMRSAVNTWTDGAEVKDSEPNTPVYAGRTETSDGCVFTWTGASSLWKKTYTLRCTALRFTYEIKIEGKGAVDSVNYFSGDISGDNSGSLYEFSEGYNPCISWYDTESHYFKAACKNHRWSVLMVPPMFCYVFRAEGIAARLALGLVARRGEHNFNSFDYTSNRHATASAFYLSTDQHGHTHVDGEWTAPYIIGYGAETEDDALQCYSDYYFSSGIARVKPAGRVPRFWRGPMVCGWLEQYMQSRILGKGICSLACEEIYENAAAKLKEYGMKPTVMIIDDKWQSQYGTDVPDPSKWKDLRAYADRRHAEGIHTLLWFKLWDGEGLPSEQLIHADNGNVNLDPSHPDFLALLDKIIYNLLSDDEGCCGCDGFKLDYAFTIPIGHSVNTYSGKYGCELLYDYMEHIYRRAKEVKPDALINCSPCHPYFAHICDQARLHDYDGMNRNCLEDLSDRARLFNIANPNTLLDTDNAGFNTRRDTMRWLLGQPHVGVPDLYTLTPNEGFSEQDILAVSELWREYSARVDAEYGEGMSDVE